MKIEIFIKMIYENLEEFTGRVNEFLTDETINVIDVKFQNSSGVLAVMVCFECVENIAEKSLTELKKKLNFYSNV